VEEFVLDGFGGSGAGLASRGSCDDSKKLELDDGGAGDVEPLGIGASVGRCEEDAVIVCEGVEERAVSWGETFDEVPGAEGEPHPETFGAGTCQEGSARETLWVDSVGEVKIAYVADGLYVNDR